MYLARQYVARDLLACSGGTALGLVPGFAVGRGSASVPRGRSGIHAVAKRLSDVVLAILALGLFSWVLLLIALWIMLDSPGPVLFRQTRIGQGGRAFHVFKFRSMHVHRSVPGTCPQATRGDVRITRVGAWLRRFSLDELPQLINVLRGEMSLVGPRPHAPGTCAAGRPFEQVVPGYAARHAVRPGITGLAQVRGWRGETETEEKILRRVQADLEYIATWSLRLDLTILVRTLWMVATTADAY